MSKEFRYLMDVWVRPNRRAILIGCALPLGAAILLTLLAIWCGSMSRWAGLAFGALALAAGGLAGVILLQLRVPRLAYAQDCLLVYTGEHRPVRLPIGIVECFFLGQAPTELHHSKVQETESRNLVVRLAERASDWHHRELKRSIGHWCDGYITINGIWCEPIHAEMLQELNHRLVAVKREARSTASMPAG